MKPTPMDRTSLHYERSKAVPAWRYNAHIALDRYSYHYCVTKVWVTSQATFTKDPATSHECGSRDSGPVYATEAEAWQACLAEVEKWCADGIARLREEAAKAGAEDA